MGAKQPQPIPMLCKVLLYTTKRPGFSTGMEEAFQRLRSWHRNANKNGSCATTQGGG